MVEYISFRPVKKTGSLVGFVSFRFDNKFSINDFPVHIRKETDNKPMFRVLYPDIKNVGVGFHPSNKETQEFIDYEISGYICANYPECKRIR